MPDEPQPISQVEAIALALCSHEDREWDKLTEAEIARLARSALAFMVNLEDLGFVVRLKTHFD